MMNRREQLQEVVCTLRAKHSARATAPYALRVLLQISKRSGVGFILLVHLIHLSVQKTKRNLSELATLS